MSIQSTHIPVSDPFDPNRINILIEDVRVNHNHAGGAEGAQVDHTTLLNRGTNTHASIDAHIADPMHGYIRKTAMGNRVNSVHSSWGESAGGNAWYFVDVLFSEDVTAPAFTVPPVVVASMTSWDRYVVVPRDVTLTGFKLQFSAPGTASGDDIPTSGGLISFAWIAVGR